MHRLIIPFALCLLLSACQTNFSSSTNSTNEEETISVVAPTATVQPEPKPDNAQQATDEQPAEASNSAEALSASFAGSSQTNGEVLMLYGQVLDVNENPQPNMVIEIWQTDATGVYDHPQDPGTSSRDTTFQFFGMATTDETGWYAFRTILPGLYEPRPRHIHFKVKQNGSTLLTSQFYFSEDIADVQDEGMFRAVGDSGELLLLQLVQGEGSLLANGRIVVDTGSGAGTLPLTPSQATGPYYPVVSLAGYDNDLVVLP